MKETAEELVAKHTRRRLEEMAEKLGIETLGIGNKTTLAEAIINAKEKASAKKMPKPPKETSKAAAPAKAQPKPPIGKKGVLAKRAAIDAQVKENEEAAANIGSGVKELRKDIADMRSAMDLKAREMLHEGTIKLQKGIREMHRGMGAQIKENEKAASKMGMGVREMQKGIKEIQSAIGNKTVALQAGVEEMYSGVKEIQNGIREMENAFREFQDETANYIKDFYYG